MGGWSLPGEAVPAERPAPTERYVPGSLLGRGGMGVVRVARDTAVGRNVALKELDPALADVPGAAARLAREAAITGRLDHPGIVAVHDVGVRPDGRPYYTMRLVRGRSLGRAIAETPEPAARRALVRHVLAAAEAVAAAHDAGIVHRDLKPANILLGPHGETQVADWGLAAPTPAARAAWAELPGADPAGVVGTPAYMAPEQAEGAPPDPRHDVWGLGATLFEVLVGAPPNGERSAPSASQPALPALPPAGLRAAGVPVELAAIVTRAMAPADARYPDAQALADDLLAWFEGRRVAAHAYTPRELFGRLVRAWRVPLAVGGVGLVGVAAAVGVGWWNTSVARDRAVAAEAEAVAARRHAETLLAHTWVEQAVDAVATHDRARAERLAADALGYGEDPVARGVLAAFGRAERPRLLAEERGPACAWSAVAPDGAWVACGTAEILSRWAPGDATGWTLPRAFVGGTFVSGGLAAWDATGRVTLLDPETGAVRSEHPALARVWKPSAPPTQVFVDGAPWPPAGMPDAPCAALQVVAVAPGGDRVAALCGEGTLLVGPPSRPAALRAATELAGDHAPHALAWTPGGRFVAGTLRGGLRLLDAATGAVLARAQTPLDMITAIQATDELVVASGTAGGIGVWDLRAGGWLGEVPAEPSRGFALRDDGTLVVFDGTLRTWSLPGRALLRVETGVGLADVAVAPDGTRLALSGGGGEVRVVGLPDGALLERHTIGVDAVVKGADFSRDGDLVAILARDPRLVSLGPAGAVPLRDARAGRRVAWLDGGLVATDVIGGILRWAGPDAAMERFDAERLYVDLEAVFSWGRGSAPATPPPGGQRPPGPPGAASGGPVAVRTHAVAVDTDGRIVRVGGDGTTTPLTTVPEARAVASDGRTLVVATRDAVLLKGPDGRTYERIAVGGVTDVAISPDGARVAAGALDGRAFVWSAVDGRLLAVLPGHAERVVGVEFLPDGDLVTVSWDHTARLWDLSVLDRDAAAIRAEVVAAFGER